jgi:hypothetical protein
MLPLHSLVAALCASAALLAGACHRVAPAPDPLRALRSLPRCTLPPLGDTTGWTRPEGAPVALPPGFAFVHHEQREHLPIHGGRLWRSGALEFEAVGEAYGTGDLAPFLDPSRWCRTQISGHLVLISVHEQQGRVRVVATRPEPRPSAANTSYLGSGPAPAARELFLRVIQTLKLAPRSHAR